MEVERLREQGSAAIYSDNLISYLKQIEASPEPTSTPEGFEEYKAHLQNWVEANKHNNNTDLEMFRSVINSGQNAMKSAFLLNGGASVALLAFIGHLAQFKPELVAQFATCLLPFVFSVFAITLTSGFTYISQWLYSSEKDRTVKWGFRLNIFCIILGLSSAGFFIWGIYKTYLAFLGYA